MRPFNVYFNGSLLSFVLCWVGCTVALRFAAGGAALSARRAHADGFSLPPPPRKPAPAEGAALALRGGGAADL